MQSSNIKDDERSQLQKVAVDNNYLCNLNIQGVALTCDFLQKEHSSGEYIAGLVFILFFLYGSYQNHYDTPKNYEKLADKFRTNITSLKDQEKASDWYCKAADFTGSLFGYAQNATEKTRLYELAADAYTASIGVLETPEQKTKKEKLYKQAANAESKKYVAWRDPVTPWNSYFHTFRSYLPSLGFGYAKTSAVTEEKELEKKKEKKENNLNAELPLSYYDFSYFELFCSHLPSFNFLTYKIKISLPSLGFWNTKTIEEKKSDQKEIKTENVSASEFKVELSKQEQKIQELKKEVKETKNQVEKKVDVAAFESIMNGYAEKVGTLMKISKGRIDQEERDSKIQQERKHINSNKNLQQYCDFLRQLLLEHVQACRVLHSERVAIDQSNRLLPLNIADAIVQRLAPGVSLVMGAICGTVRLLDRAAQKEAANHISAFFRSEDADLMIATIARSLTIAQEKEIQNMSSPSKQFKTWWDELITQLRGMKSTILVDDTDITPVKQLAYCHCNLMLNKIARSTLDRELKWDNLDDVIKIIIPNYRPLPIPTLPITAAKAIATMTSTVPSSVTSSPIVTLLPSAPPQNFVIPDTIVKEIAALRADKEKQEKKIAALAKKLAELETKDNDVDINAGGNQAQQMLSARTQSGASSARFFPSVCSSEEFVAMKEQIKLLTAELITQREAMRQQADAHARVVTFVTRSH